MVGGDAIYLALASRCQDRGMSEGCVCFIAQHEERSGGSRARGYLPSPGEQMPGPRDVAPGRQPVGSHGSVPDDVVRRQQQTTRTLMEGGGGGGGERW